MIRKASTAALRDSSGLLSVGQTRTVPPGWRPETEGPEEAQMRFCFVLWGTFIL